jgi:tRNA(fMet)-specific endonuclease VapC
MKLKYLLDTNVISDLMRPIPNPQVIDGFNIHRSEISTASIVIHELLYGCLRLPESRKRQAFLNYINSSVLNWPTFDYNLAAAECHAQERARLSKIGKTLAFADGQIASIAVTNNLILVTNNVDDFQFFNDLRIENWFTNEDS